TSQLNVVLENSPLQGDIGRFITGGELGAALQFRSGALGAARDGLNQLAAGLAASFNAQHRQGMDLNGNLGGDFFKVPGPTLVAGTNNGGSASVTAQVVDAGGLTGDEYQLSYDGSQWQLRNLDTGTSQLVAGGSVTVDGVRVDIRGSASAGDVCTLQPVRSAAGEFSLALSDPKAFAAAGPARSTVAPGNAGTGAIGEVSLDTTGGTFAALPVTLTFNPDALGAGVPGFDVSGMAGGPLPYDPATQSGGVELNLGDMRFSLSGAPVAGDQFTVESNAGGTGDSRNSVTLGALQTTGVLQGGSASYGDAYGAMVAGAGVASRQATSEATTAAAMLEQSRLAMETSQGVNLDEEAADLLRYQQAYQAAAQVIAVADTVFQTLLSATRR
ncbi:MAG: FlgK family flagellar hook-associated protein, partial [Parahaliea sp.]